MSVQPDLLYMPSHEWVRIEGEEAVIGITDFAQDSLGDITFVELPQPGDTLVAGKEMGSVESVKAASDIYSPVDGEVIAINEALESAPEKINESPYGDGWMLRVRLASKPSGLLDAKAYEEAIAKEAH
ncbi:glycine cleavage system protein GcvH [Desulfovibrio sp. OttesenSCG-928-G15]|nr:glycine cleavage system protein GcvH [Desulfovibrio sp. OttesenSCG-928-G15]